MMSIICCYSRAPLRRKRLGFWRNHEEYELPCLALLDEPPKSANEIRTANKELIGVWHFKLFLGGVQRFIHLCDLRFYSLGDNFKRIAVKKGVSLTLLFSRGNYFISSFFIKRFLNLCEQCDSDSMRAIKSNLQTDEFLWFLFFCCVNIWMAF